MHDILRDTWAYQEMVKEGREEGLREGLRRALLAIVQARFPKLVHVTKAVATTTENSEILDKLIQKMSSAQNIEEAQAALFEVSQENSN